MREHIRFDKLTIIRSENARISDFWFGILQLMETLVFEWPTGVQKKLNNGIESEDYVVWNDNCGYWIVADGVSRDVYTREGYSLALEAAKRAANAMAGKLTVDNSGQDIKEAFQLANNAVKELNKMEGLWGEGNNNYLDRDLAGTCLACLVQRGSRFCYGYVGDCRVAHISSDGDLSITPDQVLEAKTEFPQEGEHDERVVVIRKERRNNPSDKHKTYGVLTGEDAALDPKYLKFGSYECKSGDVVVVCSDGVAPFVEKDKLFPKLLLNGSREEIQAHVANLDSAYQNTDEKTLTLCRLDDKS